MESNIQSFCDYLLYEKKYAHNTVLAYQKDLHDLSHFIVKEFDNDDLLKVEAKEIRLWIVHLVNEGFSNISVNRKISSLKSFYRFLMESNQITINPLNKHKALKTSKKIQVPFSENEITQVLDQIVFENDFDGKRNQLIFALLYGTGIRRSELIHLQINNLDFENYQIKVLGKRNKERFIPVLKSLILQIREYIKYRNDLKEIKDHSYLLLNKKGVKLSESFVYRIVNTYFSGVTTKDKKSPHIMRHSFATHLLNEGADINSVKDILGHASLASTQVYTQSNLLELQKAYKKSHPRNQ
jgi:integrase/recombinase XerC